MSSHSTQENSSLIFAIGLAFDAPLCFVLLCAVIYIRLGVMRLAEGRLCGDRDVARRGL